jgi:hypothetical protein
MRKLFVAASLLAPALLWAAPAAAQAYPDPRDEEIVRSLPHPGQIEHMGDTLGRVAEAILDVPVGPILDAVDPHHRRHHRDETLGDIAAHDDPYARERMRDRIGAATAGAAAAADQLAILTPVLRRSLEDATRRMQDAMEDSRRRAHDRAWDRDRDYEDEYEPRR